MNRVAPISNGNCIIKQGEGSSTVPARLYQPRWAPVNSAELWGLIDSRMPKVKRLQIVSTQFTSSFLRKKVPSFQIYKNEFFPRIPFPSVWQSEVLFLANNFSSIAHYYYSSSLLRQALQRQRRTAEIKTRYFIKPDAHLLSFLPGMRFNDRKDLWKKGREREKDGWKRKEKYPQKGCMFPAWAHCTFLIAQTHVSCIKTAARRINLSQRAAQGPGAPCHSISNHCGTAGVEPRSSHLSHCVNKKAPWCCAESTAAAAAADGKEISADKEPAASCLIFKLFSVLKDWCSTCAIFFSCSCHSKGQRSQTELV